MDINEMCEQIGVANSRIMTLESEIRKCKENICDIEEVHDKISIEKQKFLDMIQIRRNKVTQMKEKLQGNAVSSMLEKYEEKLSTYNEYILEDNFEDVLAINYIKQHNR